MIRVERMAFKHNKKIQFNSERRRDWPDDHKKAIIYYMLDTIQRGMTIEKPTVVMYYTKLRDRIPELTDVTPEQIKYVVKNLKGSYERAISWKNDFGKGMEDKSLVRDYILKKCPFFDLLDELYGERTIANATSVDETNYDEEEDTNIRISNIIPEIKLEADISSELEANSNSENDLESNIIQQRKRKLPLTTSMSLMASACKQWSDLFTQHLEFEKVSFDLKGKMELHKLELQKDELKVKKEIELGKLDLERKKITEAHQIELKKISLEEQRLRNEELKLKLELTKLTKGKSS